MAHRSWYTQLCFKYQQMKWDYIVLSFLYFAIANCCTMGSKLKNAGSSDPKPFFHIALQEGFNKDEVHIEHNDKSIYQKNGVTTDLRIGLADSLEVPQQTGLNTIKFTLPKKHIEQSITFQYSNTVYLAVSLVGNELKVLVSDRAFGYL